MQRSLTADIALEGVKGGAFVDENNKPGSSRGAASDLFAAQRTAALPTPTTVCRYSCLPA